jgi:transposase
MSAKDFFKQWYGWGVRCRLQPIVKVARMLKRHLPGLLSNFNSSVTNATSEDFNSVIQALKYAAPGFKTLKIYGTRILFFCGRLDVRPQLPCH